MNRREGGELVEFNPEIERTLHQRRREQRVESEESHTEMAQEQDQIRTMMDYARPSRDGVTPSITRPTIAANNFEIKPAIIQMIQHSVQFGGLSHEDPNAHIASFLEICVTFKANRVSDDAIRLRLFPFSLRDLAKSWL